MSDLITTEVLTKEISTVEGKYNNIITKGTDANALTFRTMDEGKLQAISDWMPVVNNKTAAFSKQNSQTTASLMTLTMLESGPYRTLRQILAQVEKKRAALKEAMYNQEKKKIEYLQIMETLEVVEDKLHYAELNLERQKIAADLADGTAHIEAALKELGAYKERYYEILKNHNIPEDWSEDDFEQAEIEHHIKSIFRNAIRDRLQGGNNMGTMEYMEQFGINPAIGYGHVMKYLASLNEESDINTLYDFLDAMYDKFKDEYKKAMKLVGLDNISYADFLMKDNA